jgi:ABC-type hemin transport system ATPase subunit
MGERSVEEIIIERLSADSTPEPVANLVISALLGAEELNKALKSGPIAARKARSGASSAGSAEPVRSYLTSITVEGFRGIGPKITLTLSPGPGLTLVTGRNGSGKSSFAEAAEFALTGENRRWSGAGHSVERNGWRNLHQQAAAHIQVDMAEDGKRGTTTVGREWQKDGGLDEVSSHVQASGGPRQPLSALGWARPLELYRPFLSYSELGALVRGKPSEMHDAMQAILGLDQLLDCEQRLNDARKQTEAASKVAKQELPALLDKLASHPGERARTAEQLLAARTWDLAALATLASGGHAGTDELAEKLRQVTSITLPAADIVKAAIQRHEAAIRQASALSGTKAADARRLADLLSAALDHQREHAGQPCPVCGGRVLDQEWAGNAAREVEGLAALAAEADAAYAEQAAAARGLAQLVPPKPSVLSADLGREADPAQAGAAWDGWTPPDVSVAEFSVFTAAVEAVKAQATEALRRRSEAWQPIAAALSVWTETARESQQATAALGDIKKAVGWLRETGNQVRNARLAPFAGASARVWEMLRQESNVELGPITLAGAGPQRKVALDVSVDGVPGAALGVMSQGELHALGLALFLPRATAPGSPFGFVVIDDPVQSMDPAKVDGLARVLSEVAESRQVVVFTHDDRLPAALRQLQLPATVWAVTRRERSELSLKQTDDPVQRYLDDARAMAKTEQLNERVRAVAVAGLCRSALEAACHDVVRARMLADGVRHDDVERVLEAAQKLHDVMALALFGSTARGAEVVGRLRALGGQTFVNVFRDVKSGVHDPVPGDLIQLARDTEKLVKALRR